MIRSERRWSVLYSCSLNAFGAYGPPEAFLSSATASCACCAAPSVPSPAPEASAEILKPRNKFRREMFSDIAFPHFLRQIFGGSPRQRHNGQRHVLVRVA